MHRIRYVLILVFATLVGCSGEKQLADYSDSEIRTAISGFKMYVETWEKQIESGDWASRVEDGTAIDSIAHPEFYDRPEDYPEARIAELNEAIEKFRAELLRRGVD